MTDPKNKISNFNEIVYYLGFERKTIKKTNTSRNEILYKK